jgi:fructuronate reductase
MEDPARGLLTRLAAQSRSGHELAERVLVHHHLLGEELADRADFIERTGELIDTLHSHGPLAAIADASEPAHLPHVSFLQTVEGTL